jgi:hypothetical protein
MTKIIVVGGLAMVVVTILGIVIVRRYINFKKASEVISAGTEKMKSLKLDLVDMLMDKLRTADAGQVAHEISERMKHDPEFSSQFKKALLGL